jgi:hypothetical protein
MQPESIRPAARIPNFAFKDDMFIPIEMFFMHAQAMRRKRPKLIGSIISETFQNSRT